MAQTGEGAAQGNGPTGYLPALIAALLFAFSCQWIAPVTAGETVRYAYEWVPGLSITASFLIDGLSLTFALLISGIGALVLLYSNAYLAGHHHWGRFALFLTAFMLSMYGLVLADNLITLFVFWELTTITSYLLIGFGHDTEKGRRSALQALFVTGAGALALLAGFILMGLAAGSFEISEIIAGGGLQEHHWYLGILVLVLLGAFTKSAQWPFHFWLPNAMAAPTPVSAYLHSATMVKAGIYLMARLYPALGQTEVWAWTLTIAGGFTAVLASILAMKQTDLKQVLAYTTLMALGTLTLLLGQSGGYLMTAFITFLVVHSFYKAALFLVIGCVDHGTGTREADILGGLARAMPMTAAAAAFAAASMAGLPPLLGFIAKELQYTGSIAAPTSALIVTGALFAANALMFAVAGVVALRPFWGAPGGDFPHKPHEAPWAMLAGPVLLAALGFIFGVAPSFVQHALVDPTVTGLMGAEAADPKKLKLWAGVNVPLFLSLGTFAVGAVLYAVHRPLRRGLIATFAKIPAFDVGWDSFLAGLKMLAAWQTRVLQSGVLTSYMRWIFLTIILMVAAAIYRAGPLPEPPEIPDVLLRDWAVVALILGGTAIATVSASRIAIIAALGVVGIGVALVFIIFSAPDVAITQLLVETLVVVLVAVAMLRLPHLDPGGKRIFRPFDAVLACGVGIVVAMATFAVLQEDFSRRLTDYFEASSWPEAFGRNIVNVILVDFRALDTFGEIAVVMVAALSAYALLRTTKKEERP